MQSSKQPKENSNASLDSKKQIIDRLRRLEGQLRGLERMITEDAECEAVLVQFSAVKAAFDKVGALVVRDALRDCLKDEIMNVSKLDDAMAILEKYLAYLK